MKLEYLHNDGYDTVVLVADDGKVKSDWTVTPDVLADFCDCLQHPDHWDDRGGDEHVGDDYGVCVAVREAYTLTAIDVALWTKRVEFFHRD